MAIKLFKNINLDIVCLITKTLMDIFIFEHYKIKTYDNFSQYILPIALLFTNAPTIIQPLIVDTPAGYLSIFLTDFRISFLSSHQIWPYSKMC